MAAGATGRLLDGLARIDDVRVVAPSEASSAKLASTKHAAQFRRAAGRDRRQPAARRRKSRGRQAGF